MFDLNQANKDIVNLIGWIEEQQALALQYPAFNPDVDIEEIIEA